MLTKDLRIAPRATPASARRAPRSAPSRTTRSPGSKHGRTHAAMAWRHGPTPDPGRRSTVRRGATCGRTSRGTPGAAPVWHAQADSGGCRLVSTEAPDARASLALEERASRATAGGVGSAHLTRRLLVELNNAEVGVSSSAASTGASFRGRAGGPTNAIARLRLSGSGSRAMRCLHGNRGCLARRAAVPLTLPLRGQWRSQLSRISAIIASCRVDRLRQRDLRATYARHIGRPSNLVPGALPGLGHPSLGRQRYRGPLSPCWRRCP